MKNLVRFYIPLATLLLLNSCNKFLEEKPDNRVDLDTPEKCAQLLTNAYSQASYNFTEWMGDNVSYTAGTTKLPEHNQLYEWEDVTSVNQDTPAFFWSATYEAIAHANEVLAIIDDLEGDEALKKAVKAEALLCRAYGHFMLVNIFAEHYDEDRADRKDGVPYVEEPETEFIKTYTRNSIEEVYDKVERDMLDGIELVDASFYANSGKYHFTKPAALAFASRFYLFKGDYDKCIEYSSDMLGSDPDLYVKDLKTLLAEYIESQDFLRTYTSPTDPSNLLLIRNVTNAHVNVGFWPSPGLAQSIFDSPFPSEDYRLSERYPIFVRGSDNWGFGKYEFLFERSSLTSNVGLNYTIDPVFRGEEVILNRAEAYVMDNNVNAALADLQVLINKRYIDKPTIGLTTLKNYYGTANNQEAVLNFIIDERRKEFIHEGLRWFDIKRFELQVQHVTAEGNVITLDRDDDRKILQIPQAAIDVGGLDPNPR
jgi:starch-binding outer membrane protein, SusD/RagB family